MTYEGVIKRAGNMIFRPWYFKEISSFWYNWYLLIISTKRSSFYEANKRQIWCFPQLIRNTHRVKVNMKVSHTHEIDTIWTAYYHLQNIHWNIQKLHIWWWQIQLTWHKKTHKYLSRPQPPPKSRGLCYTLKHLFIMKCSDTGHFDTIENS